MPRLNPQDVSQVIAQTMPYIVGGIRLEFFAKTGITQTQFLVLVAVHARRRCSMGTLARGMHVSMPTATGVVARLVRRGYARRIPGPRDRRQVIVEVTGKGRAFIRQFQAVARHRWEEILGGLTPQELGAFHRVFRKLQQQLQPTA